MTAIRVDGILDRNTELVFERTNGHCDDAVLRAVVKRVVQKRLDEGLEDLWAAPGPPNALNARGREEQGAIQAARILDERPDDLGRMVEPRWSAGLERTGSTENALGDAKEPKDAPLDDIAARLELWGWRFLGEETRGRGDEAQWAPQLVDNQGDLL